MLREVHQTIGIDATPDDVWQVLSDITNMRHYMPGVSTVELTSEVARGVGAARHCVFDDGLELTEQVVDWDEGSGYVLETTRMVKVPMKSNQITFTIDADEDVATVTQKMEYAMKGGILAPLLERAAASRMRSAIGGALEGLKHHIESAHSDRNP